MKTAFLNFDAGEINQVEMSVAIQLMKEAFLQLSLRCVTVPVRTVVEAEKGMALFMPSYSPEWQLFGLKMVGVFAGNQAPLPAIQGRMLVMDASNGSPLALLDAASLTALRTGAASGLATELLSNRDSKALAVFGTGAQAYTQVAGVLAVRSIQRILVKGTSRKKEIAFCNHVQRQHQIACIPLEKERDLEEADVICTATTSHTALFSAQHIKPGVHINGVGSFKPVMQEIPEQLVIKGLVVVDQREAALAEAGDIIIPLQKGLIKESHFHTELGEIIGGTKSGRTSADQTTIFKSVGNAVQDLAVAHYLISSDQQK